MAPQLIICESLQEGSRRNSFRTQPILLKLSMLVTDSLLSFSQPTCHQSFFKGKIDIQGDGVHPVNDTPTEILNVPRGRQINNNYQRSRISNFLILTQWICTLRACTSLLTFLFLFCQPLQHDGSLLPTQEGPLRGWVWHRERYLMRRVAWSTE